MNLDQLPEVSVRIHHVVELAENFKCTKLAGYHLLLGLNLLHFPPGHLHRPALIDHALGEFFPEVIWSGVDLNELIEISVR